MAHLMAPQQSKPTLPVFYNFDAVVGAAPAVNKQEDVVMVHSISLLLRQTRFQSAALSSTRRQAPLG